MGVASTFKSSHGSNFRFQISSLLLLQKGTCYYTCVRVHPFIAAALLPVALLAAAPQLAAAKDDPVLPARIPGYELRALDVRKPVLLNVSGTWVQAALPVFFYFPTPVPPQAAPLLRQAYADLLQLGRKPEWTAAEFQAVLTHLDAAIRLLEQPATDPRPKTSS